VYVIVGAGGEVRRPLVDFCGSIGGTGYDACLRFVGTLGIGDGIMVELCLILPSTTGLGGVILMNCSAVKALDERSQAVLTDIDEAESGVDALRGSVCRSNTLAM
jgi:hypothetical protein